ncbi:MAG: response regulator, partial [Sinobacterium sp.]|nr:response regulator [Sinobacterium sp.]
PRYWAYFPITLDSDAKALLVIGCDEGIGAENKHLLEQANNALAIAITSARARKKVANMLEQTQIQAKELTAQQRELALINDKLEDKTTDLDKQKTEILEQNILLEASQEALLEKSTALEASGRYKSQFLSTMSHELRTPLNSILLLSEALLENRESNLSEKQVRHADVIHHAGDELLSLINDILDLSKVEEGKMDIIIDAISPEDFVHRLKTQSEVLAQDKQLDFNVQFSDDLPEFIYTDEHRLYQILKNFVSNAFKFTEHGGINVIVSMLAAGELPSGAVAKEGESFICFTVKDSGVGIAPDKQKIVFEAFKQADGTTSRKFGGSGLGLTISRELALLLGGEVALHSRGLGHGSSFMVYVPQGHESHITTDVSSASELNAYPVQENVSLPLLEQAPMPSRLPVDAIVFLSTNAAWHNMVREKSELSPIKLNTIETAVELEQYMSRKLPSAFVVDCDSTDLIEALCRENITVPVFAVGDSLSAQFKSEIEVLHWLDLHNLNHIIERSLKGADKPLARVLFVEDNPVFHEVIRSVFSKLGLSVDLVDDAVSAVNALYEKTYELIVVDLNLPDFSGEQVMQVARSMPALSGKNIVLFTAEDLQEKHKKQLLQIADEVIFKSPQAIYELANKAQLLINQSSDANGKRVHASNTNAAYQAGMLQGAKVLLVDDDERNLYSLGSALEAEGITVYSVGSGIEALEVLARGDRVDLILLDIMMPEIDGYEVLNRIRSNPDWSFYPVIALTAKAMLGDKQRCLDAGATDYLSKPVSMQTLLDKMMVYIG